MKADQVDRHSVEPVYPASIAYCHGVCNGEACEVEGKSYVQ